MILNRRLDLIEKKLPDAGLGYRLLRSALLDIKAGKSAIPLTELERRACNAALIECLRRLK